MNKTNMSAMNKDVPSNSHEEEELDDDEFRSHSFRERRLTFPRHHILSDTAAAAVAELLAEGDDDFSDESEEDDNRAAVDGANGEANNSKEDGALKVSAIETKGVDESSTTAAAESAPSPSNNGNKRRRGSSTSANSDTSSNKPSLFYLPSRILHAGEIVRRYSNEQNQGGNLIATTSTDNTTQPPPHDVRTGVYSHPTHHATSKNYTHHQHQQQTQTHLTAAPHRNKWKQRFSFCSTAPDHILPFPRHVVGTFSCHGMEPVYDSDYDNSDDEEEEDDTEDAKVNNTSIAKINQDRGGVIYPYANSHSTALFAVYDGHGEGGELVSQFALGEVSRILGGRLVDEFKLMKSNKKQQQGSEVSDGERQMKRRRRRMNMMGSVQEEEGGSNAADTPVGNEVFANDNANGTTTADNEQADDDNHDEDEEFNIIEKSLKDTFIKVDRGLLDEEEIEPMYSGTTACVVLKRHQKLYVANCGDSRAVLARRRPRCNGGSGVDGEQQEQQGFTTIPLSIDQNPDSIGEKERILDSGGYVSPPPEPGLTARVWLDSNMTQIGLAMARSIGDHAVKSVGVIAEPVVSVHTVDEELDDFVIIATDGVWEFISSEDAVEIVGRYLYDDSNKGCDASEACEALIKAATAKWHEFEGDYRDDITAMVIRLKDLW